jgi:dipeptidyl-peptidase-4
VPIMKSKIMVSVCFVGLLATTFPVLSGAQGTRGDYERAEKFHPSNITRLVFKLEVNPNWIGESPKFWYMNRIRSGKEFILVDSEMGSRGPAFDHARLAAALSAAKGESYKGEDLPFDSIEFVEDGRAIKFRIGEEAWKCNLETYECERAEDATQSEYESHESLSPDGRFLAFVRDYNLVVRCVETGEERTLTHDGCGDYYYSVPVPSVRTMVRQGTEEVEQRVIAYWSPDSKRLFTYRVDAGDAKKLYLVQAVPPEGVRPKLFTFVYPLPGEINVPCAEPIIFDVENGTRTDIPSVRRPILYYGEPWPTPEWLDADRLAFIDFERGWGTVRLVEVDARTGYTRTLIQETSETIIDPNIAGVEYLNSGTELIINSERDGWNHLYLYDAKTGNLKNRITTGEWVVHNVAAVDEDKRQVYFIAGGREAGRDPYLRHLYRINLDGSGLVLLTPEDADHSVSVSPDFKYFVDSYSKVDTVPVSVLRDCKDGKVLLELEKADIESLLAEGWRWPEPFKVKARDGKTDIYGVIYRPVNFDPGKKYPVIDNIYTGPHYVMAPKSFSRMLSRPAQSIAELGFIVINIDGLGTAWRSKEFHNYSYLNLADGGIPDHIAGFKQLAEKYPYMDLDRIGVFGFSAGGYDSAHAIFAHPDFYKVAVAASGNYDHRMDKAWWNELWMDFPVRKHYIEQSCLTIAHQLQGKLFLAHGELDENVNPYNTIRLVDVLIKANKDFDLLIVPNEDHYLDDNPYFVRKRWDFFVKHLLGVEPPQGYVVKEFER